MFYEKEIKRLRELYEEDPTFMKEILNEQTYKRVVEGVEVEKQLEFSFTNGHLEEGDNDIQWQKDNKSK